MIKHTLFALAMMWAASTAFAQTDMTGSIKNPSFEVNDTEGWVVDGMSCQGNDAFKKKVGRIYLEKWTGRGGKVGNASAVQTIKSLPAGTYTLTVAAQNIQEDTPAAVQTGVYIFANDKQTSVGIADDYTVTTTLVDGTLQIGVMLDGATGNYVCVDNFRLTRQSDTSDTYATMHQMMQEVVDEANGIDRQTGSSEQHEMDEARKAVETLIGQNTTEGVAEAVSRLQDAIYQYRLSVASPDEQVDMTHSIVNPSFEANGLAGWTNSGMWTQTGGVFPYKGSVFVESWTGAGGRIGDVSVSQRVEIPNGRYTLTAVSQNIQQGSNNAAAKGGYIFGEDAQTEVGKAKDYSVEFVVIEGQARIGFKTVSSTGNWVCVDNFRLSYIGRSDEMLLQALADRYTKADELVTGHMNSVVLSNLQQAIASAKAISKSQGMEPVAITLRQCMEAAQLSTEAYAQLQAAIAKATACHRDGTDDAAFLNAIATAQQLYDKAEANEQDIDKAIKQLDNDVLAYCIANTSGKAPTVITVSYVARGATGALGRSIVKGSNIKEKGFCWATHPEPTVLDNRTTFNYDINGPMYLMQPLEPATVYYVRAYALTNDYAVGYGEVRKVITLPMGNSGYWYNWGGSPDENERIDNALKDCIYYYNNWSATTNFTISCSYGSGTPTADCSYGGSMRVGPNASYQRTGTILHESNHGVGVGTSGRWWDTNLHDGEWKGWRANSLLQFIENNTTSKMAGDGMHMWPYGINGAHEDSGWPMLYIANVMITQALHEDGLIPPGHGGCKPAYVFEQDDDTKYYITSENNTFGTGRAYLTENSTGTLTWSEPSGSVCDNDAYAWYLTFDPKAQLYSIRNAKSGKYFSYSSGIKTTSTARPGTSEQFHLMVGRTEKNIGGTLKARPYWIMAGADVESPVTLTAQAGGKTGAPNFDISDAAISQRWFILSAREVDEAVNGALNIERDKLLAYAKAAKAMLDVAHDDIVDGASDALGSKADGYISTASSITSADELSAAITDMWDGIKAFLKSTQPNDEASPYDLTFLVSDADMQSADVWGTAPYVAYNCGEFFEKTFTMQQTLLDMPLGRYEVRLQGFQRPGAWDTMYAKYNAGTLKTTTRIYFGTKNQPIKSIMDDAQEKRLGKGAEQNAGGKYYIPDNMEAAEAYFDKGLYMNSFVTDVAKDGKINLKLSCTSSNSGYWTIFRNVSLHYLCNPTLTDVIDIPVATPAPTLYDLSGRKLGRTTRPGVYIRGGKKVVVK